MSCLKRKKSKKIRRPWQTAFRCWEKTARATERARQQSPASPSFENRSIRMLWIVKGTLRRLVRYGFVSSGSRESLRNVFLPCGFKMVKQAHKLLCGMRSSNIVVLAFRSFFTEIYSKGGFPFADILCSVQQHPTQISRTALFHFCVSRINLSRLICRRWTACKSKQLVRIIKTREITDLGNDNRSESIADSGNGKSGRIDGIHDFLDLSLNFGNLGIQFTNQLNVCLSSNDFAGRYELTERRAASRISFALLRSKCPLDAEIKRAVRCFRLAEATWWAPGNSERSSYTAFVWSVDTSFSSSGNRIFTRRETDCLSYARPETLSNLYLDSDFRSSLWYNVSE